MVGAGDITTLAQLQDIIGAVLEEALPEPLWVSAEVAHVNLNRSGHCYLELVENMPDGKPCAQARGVIWRTAYPRVAARFEQECGRELAAGMKILVRAGVTYHPVYGLALQISDIDPSYTLGDMERRKQQTIAQLQAAGLWDANRSLPMPEVVQRVAVVSSATAAGWRDFCNELSRSPYAFRTELFEAAMQGETAGESIAAALARIAARREEFDAVAIIRGGGSVADLDCYNSLTAATAAAKAPLPLLTGIGHDKDVSATDMVAAVMLKTPTAVAVWLHDRAAAFDSRLAVAALTLRDASTRITHAEAMRLQTSSERLRAAVTARLAAAAARLDALGAELRSAAAAALRTERHKVDSYGRLAENYAPERIVSLGFAVARAGERTLRSVDDVQTGDSISVKLADGALTATVTGKSFYKEKEIDK